MVKKSDKCPVCKGTGKFTLPSKKDVHSYEIKGVLARTLAEKGYSYRQIAEALGYKSTRSIHLHLKTK